jgi:hypothetical protein
MNTNQSTMKMQCGTTVPKAVHNTGMFDSVVCKFPFLSDKDAVF